MPPMLIRFLIPVLAWLVPFSTTRACPFCYSETGQQVRAAIFNDHFALNTAATLLPFPLLLAVVAWIYVGNPFARKDRNDE